MWSQARANVLEPERPALRIKTFTGRKYIVSPPRPACNGESLHVERPHEDSSDPQSRKSRARPARALGVARQSRAGGTRTRVHDRAREDLEDRGRQDPQRNPETRRR